MRSRANSWTQPGFRDNSLQRIAAPRLAQEPLPRVTAQVLGMMGLGASVGSLLMCGGMTAAADFTLATAPHAARLYRLGLRLTRQPSDAADLVQEALCRAWASWTRFERGGSVGAYLSRILVNTFISRHRHMRVVQTVEARCDLVSHMFDGARISAAEDPQLTLHANDLSDEVIAALDVLPPHYRTVVELVDIGGMPYKDAAQRLAIPLGTVMSRLHRARRIMREHLGGYARDFGYGDALAHAA